MAEGRYIPGDNYVIDEITGFKIRSSRAERQWDGAYGDRTVIDARNPQDLIRPVKDGAPPGLINSESQPDVFIGPLGTHVSEAAAAGAIGLVVESNAGMQVGDRIWMVLANGDTFRTTIAALYDVGYLLNEDGTRIKLEDGSGFLLYEDQSNTSGQLGITDPLPEAILAGAPLFDNSRITQPRQA